MMDTDNPIVQSSIWYPDGSVVIQAESTQFKVHKSVLAEYSVIFRDMFSIPVVVVDEVVDGCPLVRLSDTATDVTHFLTMLYHARQAIPEYVPLEVVAAMLRMGRKYEIKHIWEEGLSRLEHEFPSDHNTYVATRGKRNWSKIDPAPSLRAVHNLVREIGLMCMLPIVLYTMGQRDTHIKPPAKHHIAFDTQANEITFIRCTYSFLREYALRTVEDSFQIPSATCVNPGLCRICVQDPIVVIMSDIATTSDVGGHFLDFCEDDWTDGLCASCARRFEEVHRAGVSKRWKQLPGFYGLPPWEELKNEGVV